MKKIVMTLASGLLVLLFSGAAYAENGLFIGIDSSPADFIQTGYAEAVLTARFVIDGKPVPGAAVHWKIMSADNQSAAMPPQQKNSIAGLSWGLPGPEHSSATPQASCQTDHDGTAKITLADIIGERIVSIRAFISYQGKTFTEDGSVIFGKGPLSVFASPPIGPLSWLELYEVCNGIPYEGEPSEWKTGQGLVGGVGLPTMQQIQSVSLPGDYNKQAGARGAAIAAGWPHDRRYWNARAVMAKRASHVDIRNGNPHGSGGNDVTGKEYGVCLR